MLLVCLLVCVTMSAQHHFIRTSADVGFVCDVGKPALPDVEPVTSSLGAGANIGAGYRMVGTKGLLLDAGIAVHYSYVKNRVGDVALDSRKTDADGDPFTSHETWYNRELQNSRISAQVPFLIGYERPRWYIAAGAKMSMNIVWKQRELGKYTHTMEYAQYIEIIEDVPEIGLPMNEPYTRDWTGDSFRFDLRVCLEAAYRLDKPKEKYDTEKEKTRYYLGAFAEYGVFHTEPFAPLMIGVRFTALFALKEHYRCVTCEMEKGKKK